MIDCNQCRNLIDRDVVDPLDNQDRVKLTNHLRSCRDCLTYRKERLKDSSILRKSVAELKQQAEETPPPPAPPPPKQSVWPWVTMVSVLVLVVAGIITILNTDQGTGTPGKTPGPGRQGAARKTGPDSVPHRKNPVVVKEPSGPTAPSVAPSQKIRIPGVVVDEQNQPVFGARVALIRSPHPGAECFLEKTDSQGAFLFELHGKYPVYITAWTERSVSIPAAVQGPTAQVLRLDPARVVQGQLQPEEGLVPDTIKILALWTGGGRTVAIPDSGGTFQLILPMNRSVELRPFREKTRIYEFVPGDPLALSTPWSDTVQIRVRPSRVLLLHLSHGTVPIKKKPIMVAALVEGEDRPRFFEAFPGSPGTYHTSVPPGTHEVILWQPGYKEVRMEISVEAFTFKPVSLEVSPNHLSGTLQMQQPHPDVPEFITVRRAQPLFEEEPSLRVPVDGTGRFLAAGLPWSQATVDVGSGLAQRFGPYTLPFQGFKIHLQPGSSIRGMVQNAAGKPLPGIMICLESQHGRVFNRTDRKGRYRFENIPLCPVFVYPRSQQIRFESLPSLKETDFKVLVSPGARLIKDFVMQTPRISKIRLQNQEGRPVVATLLLTTKNGSIVERIAASPLAGTNTAEQAPVLIPPLVPGTYLAHVEESGVLYPLGQVNLPADTNLVIRRDQPKLILRLAWYSPFQPPPPPLQLNIKKQHGNTIGWLNIPLTQLMEIGGLEPGTYELEAKWGAYRARGWAQIGLPGSPAPELELRLR